MQLDRNDLARFSGTTPLMGSISHNYDIARRWFARLTDYHLLDIIGAEAVPPVPTDEERQACEFVHALEAEGREREKDRQRQRETEEAWDECYPAVNRYSHPNKKPPGLSMCRGLGGLI